MIIGLIVFALYLYFLVGFTELLNAIENLNTANHVFYYSLAIAATLLSVLLVSASWHSLLNALTIKTNLKNLFLYTWTGYFVDLMVPCQAVCGEVARIYLVRQDNNQNYGAIAASSVTNRIITYTISSVGLFAGILLLLSRSSTVPVYLLNLLVIALIGTAIYLAVLFYLAIEEQAAGEMTRLILRLTKALRLQRFLPENISKKTEEGLSLFHQSFETFKKTPKLLVKPFILQILSFFLNISVYILVFHALGIKTLQIDFFILVYFIVGTIQIAAAIFSVGTLEIILTNIFVLYGIPLASSGIAASLLRVLTFWLPILAGYITVQVMGARRLLNPTVREKIPG